MPRGPNINREEIRKKIYAACYKMLQSGGAGAISARKIAAKTGCSVGTIYNVYKKIDDIILEINGNTIDELEVQVKAIRDSHSDPLEAMHAYGQLYVSYASHNYHLWYALLEYPRKHGITLPQWYQEKVDRIFLIISSTILPLFHGDMEKADMATKVMWAGFHGISSLAMSGRLESVRTEAAPILVKSLIDNYIEGMRRRA